MFFWFLLKPLVALFLANSSVGFAATTMPLELCEQRLFFATKIAPHFRNSELPEFESPSDIFVDAVIQARIEHLRLIFRNRHAAGARVASTEFSLVGLVGPLLIPAIQVAEAQLKHIRKMELKEPFDAFGSADEIARTFGPGPFVSQLTESDNEELSVLALGARLEALKSQERIFLAADANYIQRQMEVAKAVEFIIAINDLHADVQKLAILGPEVSGVDINVVVARASDEFSDANGIQSVEFMINRESRFRSIRAAFVKDLWVIPVPQVWTLSAAQTATLEILGVYLVQLSGITVTSSFQLSDEFSNATDALMMIPGFRQGFIQLDDRGGIRIAP